MTLLKTAVYPGTFDPITNGHLDIVARAAATFGRLIVMVADNPHKNPLFPIEERVAMIEATTGRFANVEVDCHDGLLVEYLRGRDASIIIRGLRAVSDFEFEFQMALMNRKLAPEIETFFLMPDEAYVYLSSSVVQEIARLGGDVGPFVPAAVKERLEARLGRSSC